METVSDTTMKIVEVPGKLIAPKKPEMKEPETYEAPSAIITRRVVDEEPETQPAHP